MKKILFIWTICLICSISVFSQSKKKWEQTQSLNSIVAYQDFIAKYPDGKYTDLAKQQLTQLKEQEVKRNEIEAQQEIKRKEIEAQQEAKRKEIEAQQEAKRKEINAQRIANAKAIDEKIVVGIPLEEVLSILSWKDLESMLFPTGTKTFTGTAILNGFELGVDNGKVVSKKIIPEKLGDQLFESKSTLPAGQIKLK
jgi:hypothetical protein